MDVITNYIIDLPPSSSLLPPCNSANLGERGTTFPRNVGVNLRTYAVSKTLKLQYKDSVCLFVCFIKQRKRLG